MKHLSDRDRTWFCLLHWKNAHLDHVSKVFSHGVGIFLPRSLLQRQPDNLFISHYHMLEKQNSCKCCSWWGKLPRLSPEPFFVHLHSWSLSFISFAASVVMPFPLSDSRTDFTTFPERLADKPPFNGMKTVVPSLLQMRWVLKSFSWAQEKSNDSG